MDINAVRLEEMQEERIQRLRSACRQMRIGSTLPYTKVDFWRECVTALSPGQGAVRRIFRLLAAAPKYDLILLAGGERSDLLYLAIAGLLPWIRTPHIIADAHWQKSPGILHYAQRLVLRCGRRLTRQIQPHSSEEIAIYSRVFGIPAHVLHPVPWSPTLIGHDTSPARDHERGDYFLAGGKSFRDYDSLLMAVKDLPVTLRLGIPRGADGDRIQEKWRNLPNIEFHRNWTNAQYIRQIAGCRIFLMPIQKGLTRCTGDQTILNAMHLGKIVLATDSLAARIYIKHGFNGFLVDEGSIDAWSSTITAILAMSETSLREISTRAEETAKVDFNEHLRLIRTLEGALSSMR